MTDSPLGTCTLDPPPGGLARLKESVGRRRARPPRRRTCRALAGAAAAALALGAGLQLARAPHRAFERTLASALAETGVVHERGIARDLPSARGDVRIVVLDAAAAAPARSAP